MPPYGELEGLLKLILSAAGVGRGQAAETVEIRHRETGELLCCVAGTTLYGADLGGKDLRGADLRDVCLNRANLCGVDLRNADLRGASFVLADLSLADLRAADLSGAELSYADLRGANLCGAALSGLFGSGRMYYTQLAGAHYDARTRWPLGYDPPVYGCIKMPTEVAPAPLPQGEGHELAPPDTAPEALHGPGG